MVERFGKTEKYQFESGLKWYLVFYEGLLVSIKVRLKAKAAALKSEDVI